MLVRKLTSIVLLISLVLPTSSTWAVPEEDGMVKFTPPHSVQIAYSLIKAPHEKAQLHNTQLKRLLDERKNEWILTLVGGRTEAAGQGTTSPITPDASVLSSGDQAALVLALAASPPLQWRSEQITIIAAGTLSLLKAAYAIRMETYALVFGGKPNPFILQEIPTHHPHVVLPATERDPTHQRTTFTTIDQLEAHMLSVHPQNAHLYWLHAQWSLILAAILKALVISTKFRVNIDMEMEGLKTDSQKVHFPFIADGPIYKLRKLWGSASFPLFETLGLENPSASGFSPFERCTFFPIRTQAPSIEAFEWRRKFKIHFNSGPVVRMPKMPVHLMSWCQMEAMKIRLLEHALNFHIQFTDLPEDLTTPFALPKIRLKAPPLPDEGFDPGAIATEPLLMGGESKSLLRSFTRWKEDFRKLTNPDSRLSAGEVNELREVYERRTLEIGSEAPISFPLARLAYNEESAAPRSPALQTLVAFFFRLVCANVMEKIDLDNSIKVNLFGPQGFKVQVIQSFLQRRAAIRARAYYALLPSLELFGLSLQHGTQAEQDAGRFELPNDPFHQRIHAFITSEGRISPTLLAKVHYWITREYLLYAYIIHKLDMNWRLVLVNGPQASKPTAITRDEELVQKLLMARRDFKRVLDLAKQKIKRSTSIVSRGQRGQRGSPAAKAKQSLDFKNVTRADLAFCAKLILKYARETLDLSSQLDEQLLTSAETQGFIRQAKVKEEKVDGESTEILKVRVQSEKGPTKGKIQATVTKLTDFLNHEIQTAFLGTLSSIHDYIRVLISTHVPGEQFTDAMRVICCKGPTTSESREALAERIYQMRRTRYSGLAILSHNARTLLIDMGFPDWTAHIVYSVGKASLEATPYYHLARQHPKNSFAERYGQHMKPTFLQIRKIKEEVQTEIGVQTIQGAGPSVTSKRQGESSDLITLFESLSIEDLRSAVWLETHKLRVQQATCILLSRLSGATLGQAIDAKESPTAQKAKDEAGVESEDNWLSHIPHLHRKPEPHRLTKKKKKAMAAAKKAKDRETENARRKAAGLPSLEEEEQMRREAALAEAKRLREEAAEKERLAKEEAARKAAEEAAEKAERQRLEAIRRKEAAESKKRAKEEERRRLEEQEAQRVRELAKKMGSNKPKPQKREKKPQGSERGRAFSTVVTRKSATPERGPQRGPRPPAWANPAAGETFMPIEYDEAFPALGCAPSNRTDSKGPHSVLPRHPRPQDRTSEASGPEREQKTAEEVTSAHVNGIHKTKATREGPVITATLNPLLRKWLASGLAIDPNFGGTSCFFEPTDEQLAAIMDITENKTAYDQWLRQQ